jgi:hypothetical protein
MIPRARGGVAGDRRARWVRERGPSVAGAPGGTTGVLTPAVEVPSRRAVLVDGFEAWYERAGVRTPLTTQHYAPEVFHPDGPHTAGGLLRLPPWPRWTWRLAGDVEITQELVLPHERPAAVLRWRVNAAGRGRAARRASAALGARQPCAASREPRRSAPRPWSRASGCGGSRMRSCRRCRASRRRTTSTTRSGIATSCSPRSGSAASSTGWTSGRRGSCAGISPAARPSGCCSRRGVEGHVAPGRSRAATLGTRLIDAEATRRGALGDPLVRAGDQYLVRRGAGEDDHRGVSLVHGLGAGHVHRPPGPLPGDRAARRCPRHPAGVGGPGVRGDAAESLCRGRRPARVQHGRRLALVRGGGA